jgi:NAD(P)H-hydrate repair Nnr-like enzyme with NAD(P)H-hydrate dehydratase domain
VETHDYWQRQTAEQPLFNDLLWSRPENRRHAGKLLIIGGNLHGFSAAAAAYAEAGRAGAGHVRVLLPDSLQRTVSKLFPAAEYAPSTPVSGSFAKTAQQAWLSESAWADGVLLAGDLGRNSETMVLLESYLRNHKGQVTLVGDALEDCIDNPASVLARENTTLVANLSQLQKIGTASRTTAAFTSDMALAQLVEMLHDFSTRHAANFIVHHDGNLIVAVDGQVCTHSVKAASLTTRAAHATVWWLQNPSNAYQALVTSLL